MPSEIMDPQGLSPSSFFSEDLCFPDERQVGFWKVDNMPSYYGLITNRMSQTPGVSSSLFERQVLVDSQMANCIDSCQNHNQKIHPNLEKHAIAVGKTASHSLPWNLDHDLGAKSLANAIPASFSVVGGKNINAVASQCENGLFSSSLSELFSRKLRFSSNSSPYGHSVGAAGIDYEEEEPFESLEEMEAQTIGNLLPDDDDLLSGVIDGLDCLGQPNMLDDTEDLDFFSSVGGMELGEDGSSPGHQNSDISIGTLNSQVGGSMSFGGEHPFGEHPSRTLFVRNINSNVEDSELRTLFEQYGDIRTLYTACKHRGFVMISYYDIRSARNAMKALQNKPLRRRKLDIHYSIPKDNPSEKDINQGTLVVFNLDSSVSNDELRQIFGIYGEIKEIRETPHRSHHKFIEFYDVRAAEAALRALNRSDIAGKRIKLEPSRPGGARRLVQPFSLEVEQEETLQQSSPPNNLTTGSSGSLGNGGLPTGMGNGILLAQHSTSPVGALLESTFNRGTSFSVPNSLPSLARGESLGNLSNAGELSHSQGQLKFDFLAAPNLNPHSVPEYHDGLANGASCISPRNIASNISARQPDTLENHFRRVSSNGHSVELSEGGFGPAGNGSSPLQGHHYMWGNSSQPQQQGMMWPNSPSFTNGLCSPHPQRMHAFPRAPSHMLNTLVPINNHHVGSAPSVNPSLWDRRQSFTGESPDASVFHPGSLGSIRIPGNSPTPIEFVPHNLYRTGASYLDTPIPSKSVGLHSPHQRCMMFPGRSQMMPMVSSFESPNERTRSRRSESSSNQVDNKKQFELDLDRIVRGEDKRTTLMIKNIPNKYTSKMLLAAIDERHRGTYDFIYLPIDFKNKCNVGYAFINMTDPSLIIPFYQAFNGKKWEKFNSEKVASLAYARIQGKAALIAHFQNSSLMNEDKRCRPILFHTDGPNAGDQVPFPMGVNVRPRINKARASSIEENNQDGQLNGEECLSGDSSSDSVKVSN